MKRQLTFNEFLAEQRRAEEAARAGTSTPCLDEGLKEMVEERAAILEFCAGLSRQAAEKMALDIVAQYIKERHVNGPVAGLVAGSLDNPPPPEPA